MSGDSHDSETGDDPTDGHAGRYEEDGDHADTTEIESEHEADPGEDDTDKTELEFEDSVILQTTKTELWEQIADPAVLAECVPGAESVERLSEREYTVELTRGLSSLTISLTGEVELVEMDEPDWVVASGSAYDTRSHSDFEGLAAMEMTETDDGVRLDYRASMTFTGGVASLPTRIVGPVIRRDVDKYFENVRSVVEE